MIQITQKWLHFEGCIEVVLVSQNWNKTNNDEKGKEVVSSCNFLQMSNTSSVTGTQWQCIQSRQPEHYVLCCLALAAVPQVPHRKRGGILILQGRLAEWFESWLWLWNDRQRHSIPSSPRENEVEWGAVYLSSPREKIGGGGRWLVGGYLCSRITKGVIHVIIATVRVINEVFSRIISGHCRSFRNISVFSKFSTWQRLSLGTLLCRRIMG